MLVVTAFGFLNNSNQASVAVVAARWLSSLPEAAVTSKRHQHCSVVPTAVPVVVRSVQNELGAAFPDCPQHKVRHRGARHRCCWSMSTVKRSRGQKQLLCVLLGGNNSVQHGHTLNCMRRECVGTCSHSHNCFQRLVQTQRRCCCGPQAQRG